MKTKTKSNWFPASKYLSYIIILKKFSHFRQSEQKDCGPACLKMIANFYGQNIPIEEIRELAETNRQGTSLLNLAQAAEKIGFRTLGVKIDYSKLASEVPLPCILFWEQRHFVVLVEVNKKNAVIADPAFKTIKLKPEELLSKWIGKNADMDSDEGIALLLETTPDFGRYKASSKNKAHGFKFLLGYVYNYKKFFLQLGIGLLAGSILQLFVPFLTQNIVDIGIRNRDINFIYLILLAQLFLYLGRSSIDLIRGWILLHLSTRINVSLVSDFFIKLMKLPMSYFDVKMTGDIMQRIGDHQRIERLLTGNTFTILFSLFNLVTFSAVLIWYSLSLFTIFLIGSALYIIWILLFLKKRKEIDYKMFDESSSLKSKVIELINGMQEIKLHNAERQKRWEWEYLQARLFKVAIKRLMLNQTQSVGSGLINELKNMLITIYSAMLVIDGELTLGMMLSVSYIIGQLNSPIYQVISFVHSIQDAKISLDRLAEVHKIEDEELDIGSTKIIEDSIPLGIDLEHISFKYPGSKEDVLKDISIKIPGGKVTAIVGKSGSGKTTLLKLLLRFYTPQKGHIQVNSQDLNLISFKKWREYCGAVMQDSYVFNDTISNNIAVGEDEIDQEKLIKACEVANLIEFIDDLPLGFSTNIGQEGQGISSGQKQRLFISRAVFKDPKILLFDEATSFLDAENERIVMSNLSEFYGNRTVLVIAHRLSTVKNADQILVMEKGRIVEVGNHQELISQKGNYYSLIKNQLELN